MLQSGGMINFVFSCKEVIGAISHIHMWVVSGVEPTDVFIDTVNIRDPKSFKT